MGESTRNITALEARTHLGEVLDYIRYSKKPCFIERHGKEVAAIIDIESYRRQVLLLQYQEWIEKAVEQIKKGYQPDKIILFGSAARGEMKEGSDIDLLIIRENPKRKLDRADEILDMVDASIPLEPHLYTPQEFEKSLTSEDFFMKEILHTGKVLYEKQ